MNSVNTTTEEERKTTASKAQIYPTESSELTVFKNEAMQAKKKKGCKLKRRENKLQHGHP